MVLTPNKLYHLAIMIIHFAGEKSKKNAECQKIVEVLYNNFGNIPEFLPISTQLLY